jgi:ATP-dependent Clp protease ATP-binding subunit ClpA
MTLPQSAADSLTATVTSSNPRRVPEPPGLTLRDQIFPASGPCAEKIDRLSTLAQALTRDVRGQGHVVAPVSRVLLRGELGLTNPARPKGSFLFVGPTGVGKTELTLAIARHLGLGEPFRIDMSEFQTQDSVAELLGLNGGRSRFEVMEERLRGSGILLFDEIEKGHPLILDLLLQILDAARITVAGGKIISFAGYYVALTSNIGAREAMRMKHSNDTMFQKAIIDRVRQTMRPELFNRITLKLAFRALEWDVQREIAEALIQSVCFRLRGIGYSVSVDESGLRRIVEQGIDRELGARPLRNVAEDLIEYAIARAIVQGRRPAGVLTGSLVTDDLEFSPVSDSTAVPA